MRRRAFGLGIVAMLCAASASLVARADVGSVSIRDNYFDPASIGVTVDGSVVWTNAGRSGHTVTADDGSFDSGILSLGGSYTATFGPDATVRYHCSVHPGMRGEVIVGNGGPPDPDPEPAPTIRVPLDKPTIQQAVDAATEGTVVLVDPGTYPEAVGIPAEKKGVQIVGTAPGVVVDGRDAQGRRVRSTGIHVQADGARIANLEVRDFNEDGIRIEQARAFTIENVTAINGMIHGVYATGSVGGAIRDVDASGSGEGAIAIGGCADCDVIVERVRAHASGIGIQMVNAGGVEVRGNEVDGNATGIAVMTLASDTAPPATGAHLIANDVHDNNLKDVPTFGLSATLDLPSGVGIWLAGALHNLVEKNTIAGHDRYGVLVTQLGAPSLDDRVIDNDVANNARADLAWDGVGANVCFSGNGPGDGAEPSSSPPVAQMIYSCALPATVGAPNPSVAAQLGLSLLARYWCVADRPTCDTLTATLP